MHARKTESPNKATHKNSMWQFLAMCLSLYFFCVCMLLFQVLCNGPGTCVPLCVAGLLLGILGIKKVPLVYVESICRVQTLSLTGKILYPVSDYFFVQWSSLRDKYPKAIYLGRIVWNMCYRLYNAPLHADYYIFVQFSSYWRQYYNFATFCPRPTTTSD